MVLLLLTYVVLRALCKIDVHLISTLVHKSLYYYYYKQRGPLMGLDHDLHITRQTCNSMRHAAPVYFNTMTTIFAAFEPLFKYLSNDMLCLVR